LEQRFDGHGEILRELGKIPGPFIYVATRSFREGELVVFVIMLDHLLEVFPQHWPVSGRNSDIEVLRKQRQYSGDPEVIPRSQVQMVLLENKSLVNAQTGKPKHEAIYEQKAEKGSAR
jgi:hypothetical protein